MYVHPATGNLRAKVKRKHPIPVSKAVKKFVNKKIKNSGELNSTDTSDTNTLNGNVIVLRSGCAQGDDDFNRTGNLVSAKSFEFHLRIRAPFATVVAANRSAVMTRLILFTWNVMENSTTPTIAQVLQNTPYIISPYNYTNLHDNKMFHVMYDKVFSVNKIPTESTTVTSPDYSDIVKVIKRRWKNGHNMSYLSTTAASASKGHLYSLLVTDEVNDFPIITTYSRVFFNEQAK